MSSLELTSGAENEEIISKLIEAESIPIGMHGVRERRLKIQRLELHVKSEEDARLATLWLLGEYWYMLSSSN